MNQTLITMTIESGDIVETRTFPLERTLTKVDTAEVMKMFHQAVRTLAKLPVDNGITLDNKE